MAEVERTTVIRLMQEYDTKGPQAFFKRYGGGPASRYFLLNPDDETRRYPSASIAQAALDWPDINGGVAKYDSAVRVLMRAGFVIVTDQGRAVRAVESVSSPLALFEASVIELTETERLQLVRARVGQDIFRAELMAVAGGRCEITGIEDEALLRASHIKPWNRCTSDQERLSSANGVLLSALWDAAFDRGLVTFSEEGLPIYSRELTTEARTLLEDGDLEPLWLEEERSRFLEWHRANLFRQ